MLNLVISLYFICFSVLDDGEEKADLVSSTCPVLLQLSWDESLIPLTPCWSHAEQMICQVFISVTGKDRVNIQLPQ